MRLNWLKLNTAKTEILWSATGRRSHQLPQSPLRVGNDEVMPVTLVRDLGIYIGDDVSTKSHVTKTISGCFAVLRQLGSVRWSVSRPVFQSLAASLILTRLDLGNATIAGIPQYLLKWLQSVMNLAARLVPASSLTTSLCSSVSCTGSRRRRELTCCPCIQMLTWSSTVVP